MQFTLHLRMCVDLYANERCAQHRRATATYTWVAVSSYFTGPPPPASIVSEASDSRWRKDDQRQQKPVIISLDLFGGRSLCVSKSAHREPGAIGAL